MVPNWNCISECRSVASVFSFLVLRDEDKHVQRPRQVPLITDYMIDIRCGSVQQFLAPLDKLHVFSGSSEIETERELVLLIWYA